MNGLLAVYGHLQVFCEASIIAAASNLLPVIFSKGPEFQREEEKIINLVRTLSSINPNETQYRRLSDNPLRGCAVPRTAKLVLQVWAASYHQASQYWAAMGV